MNPKEICPRTPRNNAVRIQELFTNNRQIEVKIGDTLVTIKQMEVQDSARGQARKCEGEWPLLKSFQIMA